MIVISLLFNAIPPVYIYIYIHTYIYICNIIYMYIPLFLEIIEVHSVADFTTPIYIYNIYKYINIYTNLYEYNIYFIYDKFIKNVYIYVSYQ